MSRQQQLTYASVVVDPPTLDQYHGTGAHSVDLTRGPSVPCPQGLTVNTYRCVDLWVDGNGMPKRTPCTGCDIGRQRRAGLAPALDAPELVERDPRTGGPPRQRRPSELRKAAAAALARKLLQQERRR